MTWSPSEGLKLADAVVRDIEQALEACEVRIKAPVFERCYSMLHHRMTELIANAIDGAISGAGTVQAPIAYTNGHAEPPIKTYAQPGGLVTGDTIVVTKGPHEGAYVVGDQITLPKKARGRPKGSTKKKPKAQKEAPAVME